ncbi:Lachesin-like 6 [Homarus americanus]|uniref:Lachesin-like 6 n=1 Tax=Homarus americanus TaxID=6706 RepID=A0A8J5K9M5_HOMAM|nr:Lachesin-like 6 [Homarus americanus]
MELISLDTNSIRDETLITKNGRVLEKALSLRSSRIPRLGSATTWTKIIKCIIGGASVCLRGPWLLLTPVWHRSNAQTVNRAGISLQQQAAEERQTRECRGCVEREGPATITPTCECLAVMFTSILILCVGLLALTNPSSSQSRWDPVMITKPEAFLGQVGASITLPCSIRNAGRELIMQVKRIRGKFVVPRQYQRVLQAGKLATQGTDLTINDLTFDDADSYTCSVAWAKQTVTHTLEVVAGGGPDVVSQPSPELQVVYDPPSLRASVALGDSTSLNCTATGYPSPTLSWRKEGEAQILSENSTLTLTEVTTEDAGRYVCTASNGGVLQDQDGSFDVQGVLMMVLLQVVWYTNEGPVNVDDTHIYHTQDDIHYLQAAPGPVHILQVSPTADYGSYKITWEVESLAPIKFYYFFYRQEGSENMVSSSVEGSPTPDINDTHYLKNTFLSFTPGFTYEIMIRAVAHEHQPGPDMDKPFYFTAPATSSSVELSDGPWKFLKSALTVMSRLPKVVRVMQ